LGITKTTTDTNLTDPSNPGKETYYCTGLNISCSELLLSYLDKSNLQHPISCTQ